MHAQLFRFIIWVMVQRANGNLREAVKIVELLISKTDDRRLDFSKVLLTIYTPVSSGLLFLSTSIVFDCDLERYAFLTLATSSVLIVISALIERLGYFLISNEQTRVYVQRLKESVKNNTPEILYQPLDGKNWHSNIVKSQVFIMTALVVVNLMSALTFIYLRV